MKWNNKGHQFDEWGNHFRKRNRIYIYGAAEAGARFVKQLDELHIGDLIDGFIDRDVIKQENGFLGKPVYSPDIIFEKHEEHHIIVPAFKEEKNANMLIDRLIRAGYVENWDWFRPEKFILSLNDVFLPVLSMYALNKLIISSLCIIPTTKCNLNCRDCLNFTPYLTSFEERSYYDLCKDIDNIFMWVDYTYRFQISGGEPMLYNKFSELTTYIGEKYREKIDIYETVLNGTIIPGDDICEVMKKYDMTVYLDNYTQEIPEKLDKREEIIKKLEEYKLNWIDNTVDKWFGLDVFHTDNSNMDERALTQYYDSCNNPWHCFDNGKMYACNFARFAMNTDFNCESENDYFDLSTVDPSKRMEFLEFSLNYTTKGYVDFCKRCAGWSSINTNPVPVAVQMERRI